MRLNNIMKLEYIIDENTTIKEFIYKNISRNFYGYLKEHNVIYNVEIDEIVALLKNGVIM